MIYEDKCFNCPLRKEYVDPKIEEAKKFWKEYNNSYCFECGAVYNPGFLNNEKITAFNNTITGVEIASLNCKYK